MTTLTDGELRNALLETLCAIAPEMEGEEVPDDVDFREEFDLDSLDFLRFLEALHKRFGIDIPETYGRQLSSLAGAV
ncbi:MAG: acyl carrier protein, partial [Planctomycetota bacterium]